MILSKRSILIWTRNKFAMVIKIVLNIIFALIFGVTYSSKNTGYRAIQDTTGLLFFVGLNTFFSNLFGSINVFIKEKLVVQRELKKRSYRLINYYVSKMVTEIPYNFFGPILFGAVVYWVA